MCGIVGIIGKNLGKADLDAFELMLFMDTLRGFDSTGVYALHNPKNYEKYVPRVVKRALAGPDFLSTRAWSKLRTQITSNNMRGVVGHNRAATRGTVCDETAHPFQSGDITLVHNGSLNVHRSLAGGNDCEVDSEAISLALNACESREEVVAVLESLQGSFSLVWHNDVDNTLNFCRNEERPMVSARVMKYDKGKQTPTGMIFASVEQFITYAAKKAHLTISNCVNSEPGKLYTYDMDKLELVATTDVEVYDPKKYQTNRYGNGWGSGRHGATNTNATKTQQNGGKNGTKTTTGTQDTNTIEESLANCKDRAICPKSEEWVEFYVDYEGWEAYRKNPNNGHVPAWAYTKDKIIEASLHNIGKDEARLLSPQGVVRAKVFGVYPNLNKTEDYIADVRLAVGGIHSTYLGDIDTREPTMYVANQIANRQPSSPVIGVRVNPKTVAH